MDAVAGSDQECGSEVEAESELPWGNRVEMKNLASVRAVIRAVEHESARQAAMLEEAAGSAGLPLGTGTGDHGMGGNRNEDDSFLMKVVEQETRAFDALKGTSRRLRTKEDAPDYRFMPCPDLQPLVLPPELPELLISTMPYTLQETRDILQRPRGDGGLGVSEEDAATLVGVPGAIEFCRAAAEHACSLAGIDRRSIDGSKFGAGTDAQQDALTDRVVKWVLNESLGSWEELEIDVAEGLSGHRSFGGSVSGSGQSVLPHLPASTSQIGELAWLVQSGYCSGKVAKDVHGIWVRAWQDLRAQMGLHEAGGEHMKQLPKLPEAHRQAAVSTSGTNASNPPSDEEVWLRLGAKDVVDAIGGAQLSDPAAIEAIVLESLDALGSKGVETARKYLASGNERMLGFFVGAVLKASKGSANPEMTRASIKAVLPAWLERQDGGAGKEG